MLGQIHHIEIYVSDLKKSVEFWGWLLERVGYKRYQQWEKGQSYKLENTYIVFIQAEKRFLDIPYHRKRVGLNHIAFRAPKGFIEEIKNELVAKGVQILYKKRNFDDKIFFEDPDRIKIELAAY